MTVKHAARPLSPRHVLWVRAVLLCMLFSALHGLLGAWVVPAVASGPVAEICTPNGLRWVLLTDEPAEEHPADWPPGLAQPCAWASAHTAVMPGDEGGGVRVHAPPCVALAAAKRGAGHHLRGDAERVLLMAPMRGPPASGAERHGHAQSRIPNVL